MKGRIRIRRFFGGNSQGIDSLESKLGVTDPATRWLSRYRCNAELYGNLIDWPVAIPQRQADRSRASCLTRPGFDTKCNPSEDKIRIGFLFGFLFQEKEMPPAVEE